MQIKHKLIGVDTVSAELIVEKPVMFNVMLIVSLVRMMSC